MSRRLTRKQREEAVTLLRCMADSLLVARKGWGWPLESAYFPARDALGTDDDVRDAAETACMDVGWTYEERDPVASAYMALEAAARLEEGWEP